MPSRSFASLALALLLGASTLAEAQNVRLNPSSIANQSSAEEVAEGTEMTGTQKALALLNATEQDLDERIREVAAIVASDPNNPTTWAVLGELRLEAGESETALLAFERAVAKDPTLASSWHWIGTLKKRRGDLEGSLQAFENALANGAPRSQQLNEIAVTLAMMGRANDALKRWDEAIDADPQWGVLYTNAMKGALMRGDEKLARQYFDRGLEAERFEEVMVLMWGDHLVQKGREKDALQVYEAGLAKKPDSARILYAQGMTMKERRLNEEAVVALGKSREAAIAQEDFATREAAAKALFSIQHPEAHRRLVRATEKVNTPWSEEKKLEAEMIEARTLLDSVIVEHPDLWEPYLLRGTALRRLNNGEAAEADFAKVLSIIPDQPNAHINMAILEQQSGDVDAARSHAGKAIAASGSDWTIALTAGFLYVEMGDCDAAREMVREARRRLPAGIPEDPTQVLADEIAAICG
jgi:tetratricopeptide (TPR) repeat protein